MPSLKEVKNRITSVVSTQQITKAMKMVAASKLRRAQDQILQMRPYAYKLAEILRNVSAATEADIANDYAVEREPRKILLVVITSDRGLAGAFNNNIFKATQNLIQEQFGQQHANKNLTILPIGKKGGDFFRKKGYTVLPEFVDLFHNLNFDGVREAAEFAMSEFIKGNFDRVILIYNEFKNVATQIIRTEQFLPIEKKAETQNQKVVNIDYIFEPSRDEILLDLIPKTLKIQFYKSLLESHASEHGARMTAMGQATDNAAELLKELRLTYNRTRQAAITKEILEIVAGANALQA